MISARARADRAGLAEARLVRIFPSPSAEHAIPPAPSDDGSGKVDEAKAKASEAAAKGQEAVATAQGFLEKPEGRVALAFAGGVVASFVLKKLGRS